MKQYLAIACPACESEDLVKNGHSENDTHRYRCKDCRRSFQWEYTYQAWLPEVKAQIETQTRNGSGIRDISRNLGISKTTVLKELKPNEPAEVNVGYADYLKTRSHTPLAVEGRVAGDEVWSYVKDKSHQRWTWYVVDRATGIILAHHNDRRTDDACQALLKKVEIFPIATYYTDNWQSYAKFIDADKHVVGKQHTQKIERTNLNFRTHIKRLQRKMICFSKDEALHDKVIGLYIEHEYYRKFDYAKTA